MKKALPITTLFADIGGVLLAKGWDHLARKRAGKHFKLNWAEMDQRHRLVFETHEEGKLSFEEYLGWVVFFEKRPFTRTRCRDFMFAQSKPYPKMLHLIAQLKAQHGFRVVVINNKSREVNGHRIATFRLDLLAGTFISTCFVGMRKPDVEIVRLALDLAQTVPERAVFMDNTPMFVQICGSSGDERYSLRRSRFDPRSALFIGVADERRNLTCPPISKGDQHAKRPTHDRGLASRNVRCNRQRGIAAR